MFNTLSLTGSGILVLLVKNILTYIGIVDIDDNMIERLISGVIDVAGILMTIIGQARRSDLKMGLIRK
jgi:hypothetical protein